MKTLSKDWLTKGHLDFEYKKYMLLAYLQYVSRNYEKNKIYPFLNDLIEHYQNLATVKEQKELVQQHFPKKLKQIDIENLKLEYEQMMHDDQYLAEIEKILDFAIPRLQESLREGKELFDFVEKQLQVEPIGVLPLNRDAGYLLLKQKDDRHTVVYNYEITLFERADEKYRAIKTKYVAAYEKSITNTFEGIKLKLLKNDALLPNPATFLLESEMSFPFKETLFPVAKRYFVRYLSTLS